MARWCETFNRERIGFRSPKGGLAFVWYPRRGSVEIWVGRFAAMRLNNDCGGRWYFTKTGQFIFGLGDKRTVARG